MILFENQIITGVLLGIVVSLLSMVTNLLVSKTLKDVSFWGGWVAGFLTRLVLFLTFAIMLIVLKGQIAFIGKIDNIMLSLFAVIIFTAIIDTLLSLYRIKQNELSKKLIKQKVMVKK